MADLITTCFSGRNRKCADAFAKASPPRSWEDIEAALLGGQKLQGTLTAIEVDKLLKASNASDEFPLFTTIADITNGVLPPSAIVAFKPSSPSAPH